MIMNNLERRGRDILTTLAIGILAEGLIVIGHLTNAYEVDLMVLFSLVNGAIAVFLCQQICRKYD
jgi:hypothetical protein